MLAARLVERIVARRFRDCARRGEIVNSAKAICTASLLLALLSGCASDPSASLRNQEPRWTKVHVAGSRIARRVDSFGNADTGTLVQTISDEQLRAMPGTSLGDKLSGTPGSI
jgi:hypothetical protein